MLIPLLIGGYNVEAVAGAFIDTWLGLLHCSNKVCSFGSRQLLT
jgi:hypothetical protein